MEKSNENLQPNVLISGVSRGLGLAIAKTLLQEGFRVIGIARSHTPAMQELIAQQSCFHFYPYDLEQASGLHGLVRSITSEHGHIFGLVNNAGLGQEGILANLDQNQIAKIIAINLQAPIVLTKYVLRSMFIGGKGRVVNISSISAHSGFAGLSVYGATKAGIVGFTRSLAREVGERNICVNAICPGYMETDMTKDIGDANLSRMVRRSPMKKLIEVNDVAAMTAYLLGPNGAHITGASFTIDAGSTI